jgi:hypothetical protein
LMGVGWSASLDALVTCWTQLGYTFVHEVHVPGRSRSSPATWWHHLLLIEINQPVVCLRFYFSTITYFCEVLCMAPQLMCAYQCVMPLSKPWDGAASVWIVACRSSGWLAEAAAL